MASNVAPETELRWGSPAARWVIAATVGGSSLAMLDSTTVNVALPAMGLDLGARVRDLQWVLNGYTLALASLMLLAGSLADRFGRRRIFTLGIVWFTVASLLCAVAPTPLLLIVARVLQGIGGALLTPGSLAILQATFATADRARAVGAWAGLGAIAGAVGPMVGGWLVATLGWRSIFWTNVPIAVAVLWITFRHVPEHRSGNPAARFDLRGAALATCGLGAVTWALITGGADGASSAVIISALLGASALALFIVIERHADAPLVPLSMFRSRQFSAINVVTFVVYGGMAIVFFLLMVQLQVVVGVSPFVAGTALLPVTVLMFTLSARMGALAHRIGPRRPLVIGPLIMAGALVGIARIDQSASLATDVFIPVTTFGVGLTIMVAPLTSSVLEAAGTHRSGIASAINNAVARTAGLLTVAAVPGLVGLTGDSFAHPARVSDGFTAAMYVAAAMVAVGACVALGFVRDGRADA
ncbi:MAG: MFS transporter [Nitriliruptoraceae bacterium]